MSVEHINNGAMKIDGVLHVKVTGFPDANGESAESMWVELVSGDEYEGVGRLANDPMFFEHPCGTSIRFGGGTDKLKAVYLGLGEALETGERETP